MIYSQYIDGGGVPIALALEEMGFSRYGTKGKSLFTTPPTKPIDALTMKPESGKSSDFYPAKYIMITGNDKLSPDKVGDMAAITNNENSDGKFVKVVIISKAGSEGLDFKCIRQVHILEPWYNMNRLDQIIGRAVRNLSHCLLPYHSRNVEIYLYGTELNKNEEEAIDLYMYRLAERKAIQIGVVSRVLKENATDCLLNKGQTQRLAAKINVEVTQYVASSNKPIKYMIGDKDNSLLCDFMTCGYKCKPFNGKITESEINSDTYDEKYIIMNLDKILQRIRYLFREKYFYKKEELIASINAIKIYPLEQIYSALNFFIVEKNEYLNDILGRIGTLVNIGDYYMFQPIELENPHITRYERETPIDYKRKLINFTNLPEIPLAKDIIESSKKQGTVSSKQNKTVSASNLMQNIQDKYKNIHNLEYIYSKERTNWSKVVAWTIYNLNKYNGWDKTLLERLAFEHIIDSLNYKEKLQLCNIIYSLKTLNPMTQQISDYFDTYKVQKGKLIGISLANYKSTSGFLQTVIVKHGKKWKNASEKDLLILLPEVYKKFDIKNRDTNKILSSVKINKLFGFMTSFAGQKKSGSKKIVYKTKSLQRSNKGRILVGQVCTRGIQKKNIIEQINSLLPHKSGIKKYSFDSNKSRAIKNIYGKTDIIQKIEKII